MIRVQRGGGEGEGVGGAAYMRSFMTLRKRGLPRVFLETERLNERVRRFYTRHRFEEEDRIWMANRL